MGKVYCVMRKFAQAAHAAASRPAVVDSMDGVSGWSPGGGREILDPRRPLEGVLGTFGARGRQNMVTHPDQFLR
jgi:hypothetical protein